MRYFYFIFFLCAVLCVAAGAKCYAAQVYHYDDRDVVLNVDGSVEVYEYEGSSVSDNDISVSGNDLDQDDQGIDDNVVEEIDDVLGDVLQSISDNNVSYDVVYFDHIDDGGNLVTSKYTKYADGPTLYITQEDYPGGLSTFANYNTYYGLISSQYLDLFKGLAAKLHMTDHYVCARVSQYEYIFAYCDNLVVSNSNVFSGTDVNVVSYRTDSNGVYTYSKQNTFSLNASNYIVYSDLSNKYPSLLTNHDIYSKYIFLLFGICIIGYFINSFYGKGVVTNALRKSKKREVY